MVDVRLRRKSTPMAGAPKKVGNATGAPLNAVDTAPIIRNRAVSGEPGGGVGETSSHEPIVPEISVIGAPAAGRPSAATAINVAKSCRDVMLAFMGPLLL